jgi:hypothetical protein
LARPAASARAKALALAAGAGLLIPTFSALGRGINRRPYSAAQSSPQNAPPL